MSKDPEAGPGPVKGPSLISGTSGEGARVPFPSARAPGDAPPPWARGVEEPGPGAPGTRAGGGPVPARRPRGAEDPRGGRTGGSGRPRRPDLPEPRATADARAAVPADHRPPVTLLPRRGARGESLH